MKRKLNKIGIMVMTTIMFTATLLLSVEKNESGNWSFSAAAYAQSGGSEDGGGSEGNEPCGPNKVWSDVYGCMCKEGYTELNGVCYLDGGGTTCSSGHYGQCNRLVSEITGYDPYGVPLYWCDCVFSGSQSDNCSYMQIVFCAGVF